MNPRAFRAWRSAQSIGLRRGKRGYKVHTRSFQKEQNTPMSESVHQYHPIEPWRTSRSCAASNCVQVASLTTGEVGFRDSKQRDSPILPFSRSEFAAFVQGVKAGDFDDLC